MALVPQPLDLDNSERKLWLVKVPAVVAGLWRAQCERAARTGIDGDQQGGQETLGNITFVRRGESDETDCYLDVTAAEGAWVPKRYKMAALPDSLEPGGQRADVFPLSYQKSTPGAPFTLSKLRVEGMVTKRFDAQPLNTFNENNGAVVVDPAYHQLSKQRMERSETKTRVVREMKHDRLTSMQQLSTQQQENKATRKQNVVTKAMAMDKKRTRMDKDQLETLLFQLFLRNKAWAFLQLQKETQQPAMFLKEVLGTIAVLVKKGPAKDQYVLKKEYAGGHGGDDGEAAT